MKNLNELSSKELKEINGGIAPILVYGAYVAVSSGAFGAGLYAGYKFATKKG